jgi:hypothetical protein
MKYASTNKLHGKFGGTWGTRQVLFVPKDPVLTQTLKPLRLYKSGRLISCLQAFRRRAMTRTCGTRTGAGSYYMFVGPLRVWNYPRHQEEFDGELGEAVFFW